MKTIPLSSDLETDIGEIEAILNVLNQLVDDFELASASDRETAVAWMVRNLNPPVERVSKAFQEGWDRGHAGDKARGSN